MMLKKLNNLIDDDDAEENEYASGTFKKLKVFENDTGPVQVALVDIGKNDKSKLYPSVRNKFNENVAMYRSQGIVFVNPNNFIRVKMTLEEIQKLTKTDKHTTQISIGNDGSITQKSP